MWKRTKLEAFGREVSPERNQDGDGISDLPDEVLLHILSFLESKQVVRSSVLSKRWLPLWAQVPTLTITHRSTKDQITKCLQQYLNLNTSLPKFHVHYGHCVYSFDPRILGYLEFAMKKKVQDLQLHISIYDSLRFPCPDFAYCNSSLIRLSLHNFNLVPEGGISWTSLKSLSLWHVTLGKNTLEKILVGCPMLEILHLYTFSFPGRHVDIKSEVLKELVFSSSPDFLGISAPNLQYLYLGGFFHHLRLRNLSSLSTAELHFGLHAADGKDHQDPYSGICCCLLELFQAIRHVVQLQLGSLLVRFLSMLEVKGFSASLPCLKNLTLGSGLSKLNLPGILFLLKGSPNLEKLVITWPSFDFPWFHLRRSMRKQLFEYSSHEKCLKKTKDELGLLFKNTSTGLIPSFLHLKSLKVPKLGERETRSMIQLVQFLLHNAPVLELVEIIVGEDLKSSSYQSRLSKRFTRLRRWFPRTKILVH